MLFWLRLARVVASRYCCPRFFSVVSFDSAQGCRQGDCGRLSAQGRTCGEGPGESCVKISSSSSFPRRLLLLVTTGVWGQSRLVMVAGIMRGEHTIGSPTWPRSGGPRTGEPYTGRQA